MAEGGGGDGEDFLGVVGEDVGGLQDGFADAGVGGDSVPGFAPHAEAINVAERPCMGRHLGQGDDAEADVGVGIDACRRRLESCPGDNGAWTPRHASRRRGGGAGGGELGPAFDIGGGADAGVKRALEMVMALPPLCPGT